MASRSNLVAFLPSSLARGRRRDVAAHIVQCAAELPEDDRTLITAVFAEGRTVLALARRQTSDPAAIAALAVRLRRRVRRLTHRLLDPAFDLVRTRSCTWSPALARVGHARYILGLSIRETADRLRLSTHTVRNLSQVIRTLAASPPSSAALSTPPPAAGSIVSLYVPAAPREAAA